MAIAWEAPKSAPPSMCLVHQLPTPMTQEFSYGALGTSITALPGPRVPSSLITWPSLPRFCSRSDPSPISTWTHCLPQLLSWQQLLFTHQVSPHPKIHFWFQSCRFRGSEFQASRIGLPAPLLPSPTRLRIDRHKESKGRSGEEGGAGTERDTA